MNGVPVGLITPRDCIVWKDVITYLTHPSHKIHECTVFRSKQSYKDVLDFSWSIHLVNHLHPFVLGHFTTEIHGNFNENPTKRMGRLHNYAPITEEPDLRWSGIRKKRTGASLRWVEMEGKERPDRPFLGIASRHKIFQFCSLWHGEKSVSRTV